MSRRGKVWEKKVDGELSEKSTGKTKLTGRAVEREWGKRGF